MITPAAKPAIVLLPVGGEPGDGGELPFGEVISSRRCPSGLAMPAMAPAGIVWLYPAWLCWVWLMLPAGAVWDKLELPIERLILALGAFAQTVLCLLMGCGVRGFGALRRRLSSGLASGSG